MSYMRAPALCRRGFYQLPESGFLFLLYPASVCELGINAGTIDIPGAASWSLSEGDKPPTCHEWGDLLIDLEHRLASAVSDVIGKFGEP